MGVFTQEEQRGIGPPAIEGPLMCVNTRPQCLWVTAGPAPQTVAGDAVSIIGIWPLLGVESCGTHDVRKARDPATTCDQALVA